MYLHANSVYCDSYSFLSHKGISTKIKWGQLYGAPGLCQMKPPMLVVLSDETDWGYVDMQT